MQVQDLMSRPAVTCEVHDSLQVAAKLMWDHDCGALPVVRDDGTLAGMITDRDICMAACTQGRPLAEILVANVMSRHVISTRPEDEVDDVEQLMADHQVKRIPVLDPDGKPLGMVSVNDVAIESVQPDTRMNNAFATIAHMVAAISQPRAQTKASER